MIVSIRKGSGQIGMYRGKHGMKLAIVFCLLFVCWVVFLALVVTQSADFFQI